MAKRTKKAPAQVETRDTQSVGGLTPRELRLIAGTGTFPIPGGVVVNERTALGLPAVFSAVDLISSTIASLEHHCYRRLDHGGKEIALDHVVEATINLYNHEEDNRFKFWRTAMVQTLTFGNSYAEIERDDNDRPYNLHLLFPPHVEIKRHAGNGKIVYLYKQNNTELEPRDVLHFNTLGFSTLEGLSPVRTAMTSLGIGLGANEFYRNFLANGIQPTGKLKVAKVLDELSRKRLKEQVTESQSGVWNAGRMMILEPGWDWEQSSLTPVDANFHEISQRYIVRECARIFRVPLSLLMEGDHESYNANESSNQAFIQLCLRSWLTLIESEIHKKLFLPQERSRLFTEFRLEGLLRGNLAARSQYYSTLFGIGAVTQNEVRAAEGLNPVEGGDRLFLPVNNLAPVADQADDDPDTTAPDEDLELFRSVEGVVWAELGRALRRAAKASERGKLAEQRDKLVNATVEGLEPLMPLVRQFNPDATAQGLAERIHDLVGAMDGVEGLADLQRDLTAVALSRV